MKGSPPELWVPKCPCVCQCKHASSITNSLSTGFSRPIPLCNRSISEISPRNVIHERTHASLHLLSSHGIACHQCAHRLHGPLSHHDSGALVHVNKSTTSHQWSFNSPSHSFYVHRKHNTLRANRNGLQPIMRNATKRDEMR